MRANATTSTADVNRSPDGQQWLRAHISKGASLDPSANNLFSSNSVLRWYRCEALTVLVDGACNVAAYRCRIAPVVSGLFRTPSGVVSISKPLIPPFSFGTLVIGHFPRLRIDYNSVLVIPNPIRGGPAWKTSCHVIRSSERMKNSHSGSWGFQLRMVCPLRDSLFGLAAQGLSMRMIGVSLVQHGPAIVQQFALVRPVFPWKDFVQPCCANLWASLVT